MFAQLIGVRFVSALLLAAQADPGDLTADQKTQIALEALKHPENAANGLVALLVPFAFFATILVIFWLAIRQRQARIRVRTEFHKHLLDKFNSGREFADFLESKGSQRFLAEIWSQSIGPKDRVLTAMRNGIVLAALGLGMLGLSLTRRGFVVPAVLVLALGVGFLVSTAISYRLSKQWDQTQSSESENAPVS
jgi:hypothetical protein